MTTDADAAPDGPSDEATATRPQTGRRLFWLTAVIAVVVIAVDQLTKWWAESTLGDGQTIPLLGDLLGLKLVYNPGAAFGIGEGFTWILAILAGVVAIGLAIYAWRVRSGWWALVFGLVLGGAITHFGDRAFRDPGLFQGHVVDFIKYGDWFIGNIADIAIVGGAILGALLVIFGVKMGREAESAEAEPEPSE